MGLIVLIAFFVALGKIWVAEGAATPIKFFIVWLAAMFGFAAIGLHSGFFQAFQALLAILAWFVAKAKG